MKLVIPLLASALLLGCSKEGTTENNYYSNQNNPETNQNNDNPAQKKKKIPGVGELDKGQDFSNRSIHRFKYDSLLSINRINKHSSLNKITTKMELDNNERFKKVFGISFSNFKSKGKEEQKKLITQKTLGIIHKQNIKVTKSLPSFDLNKVNDFQHILVQGRTVNLSFDENYHINRALLTKLGAIDKDNFFPRLDIASLTIEADTIILGHKISIPGAEITFKAKKLILLNDSQIINTPAKIELAEGQPDLSKPALSGNNAPKMNIFVQEVEYPTGGEEQKFFDLSGAEGTDGENGRIGRHYSPNKIPQQARAIPSPKGEYWTQYCNIGNSGGDEYRQMGTRCWGSATKLANGGKGGTSQNGGLGGAGGILNTNAKELLYSAIVLPGRGGLAGKPGRGGAGHNPRVTRYQTIVRGPKGEPLSIKEHKNISYPGSPGDLPKGCKKEEDEKGNLKCRQTKNLGKGEINLINDTHKWLSKAYINFNLKYANMLFFNGHTKEAKKVINSLYGQIFVNNKNNNPVLKSKIEEKFRDNLSILSVINKIHPIKSKLDNNLDYFGNPQHWAPNKKLSKIIDDYKKQIKSFGPAYALILYADQLEKRQMSEEIDITKVLNSIVENNRIIKKSHKTLKENLLELKDEKETLKYLLERSKKTYNQTYKRIADNIRQNAEGEAKRKNRLSLLKTLGAMTSLVPTINPIFGAGITTFSNFLNNVDSYKNKYGQFKDQVYMGSALSFLDLIDEISSEELEEKISNHQENLKDYLPKDYELDSEGLNIGINAYVLSKKWGPVYKNLKGEYQNWKKSEITVDYNKLEQEILKIQNNHPVLQKMAQEVIRVAKKKLDIENKITKALKELSLVQYQYIANFGITSQILDAQSDNQVLKLSTTDFLREFNFVKNGYKKNLAELHYTMGKAYEHEFQRKWDENAFTFIENNIFNFITEKIEKELREIQNKEFQLSSLKDISEIYNNLSETIFNSIFTKIEKEMHKKSSKYVDQIDYVLNQKEIKALNNGEIINISTEKVHGFYFLNRNNVRLKNVQISEIDINIDDERGEKNIEFIFQYSGVSLFTDTSGNEHIFNLENGRSFKWKTSFDLTDQSLSDTFIRDQKIVLPGANTTITLRKDSNDRAQYDIDYATVTFDIVYEEKNIN